MTMRTVVLLGAALALAACATAAPPPVVKVEPAEGKVAGYLAAGAIDGKRALGPPPAPDSIRGRADQATYEDQRKLDGTARWKTAQADNDLWNGGALKRYACAINHQIDAESTPVTTNMLHRVEVDVRTIGTPPKDFFARRRPALGNDKPVCVPREPWMETNASYPSGHSMTGWAWALVLSELAPDKVGELLEAGREMGTSRVICGVHYESDVEAGRTLGAGMVARLHAEPQFVADMVAAKRELAAAPPAKGCPY